MQCPIFLYDLISKCKVPTSSTANCVLLLSFGAESFVFQFAIQKCKDKL